MAAQLTGTKRLARRGDHSCSSRAITSLPVPVSPVSSTGIDVGATRATCATMRREASLLVTTCSGAMTERGVAVGDDVLGSDDGRVGNEQLAQPLDQLRP